MIPIGLGLFTNYMARTEFYIILIRDKGIVIDSTSRIEKPYVNLVAFTKYDFPHLAVDPTLRIHSMHSVEV